MRIAYIAAGAAGMYCGSCLHDNTLAAALIEAGHEVALLPIYTPLRTDEDDVSADRVFYGAVNVYLQQKSRFFRRMPAFVERWLDNRGLLNQVSKLSSSTDAGELGELTLSVLQGEDGRQAKELQKLVDWLQDYQPDLVQLTNALLLGMAPAMRQALGVPVICGLTGEDLFLDYLPESWRQRVSDELRRRAGDADAYVATSRYYTEELKERLALPPENTFVVPLGIRLSDVPDATERDPQAPPLIGYLARQCPEKGLDLLVEAFLKIAAKNPAPRLEVAGYVGPRDRPFVAGLEQRVADAGFADRVTFHGEVDRQGKLDLLSRLDIFSVPTVYREPKGLSVLEALAHGVPVVQPRHGAFPEIIQATGGGVLTDPGSVDDLVHGLERLLDSPNLRHELGRRGRDLVHRRFHAQAMAEETLAVYRAVLEGAAQAGEPTRNEEAAQAV
ncbi:MAG: glycosyltransferase family 4 protein [Acidobacteriota bacterium]